jgi:Ca2+-binding EF-hand superfamily protein
MNFEKFYNICHDFGLVQEAEREALRWSFKKYAKNLSEIDYTRFGKILAELFAQDTKKKELFEHRICQFKNDWSLSNKPSLE